MGRPKKSAPTPVEPEDEVQESPDEEPAAVIEPEPADDEGDGPKKSEAVRQAIKAGYDKPSSALPWIMETFGIEMIPQHFSAIKSTYLKKQGAAAPVADPAKRGPKPKATSPAPAAAQVAAASKAASNGEADLIGSMETLKPLVASMGADKVKRLVDLLG